MIAILQHRSELVAIGRFPEDLSIARIIYVLPGTQYLLSIEPPDGVLCTWDGIEFLRPMPTKERVSPLGLTARPFFFDEGVAQG